MLKSWKTTINGAAGFLVGGAVYMKWISVEQSAVILAAIVGLIGLLAKDGDVTGGSRSE